MSQKIRSYSELIAIPDFFDRYEYLKLGGMIGADTFGFDRYMNQMFYRSDEWKKVRNKVILRDSGCDLGIEGRDILDKIIVHHMNPISPDDIKFSTEFLLNPDYLICCTDLTHRAIHYGSRDVLLSAELIIRAPNDTCPWR